MTAEIWKTLKYLDNQHIDGSAGATIEVDLDGDRTNFLNLATWSDVLSLATWSVGRLLIFYAFSDGSLYFSK